LSRHSSLPFHLYVKVNNKYLGNNMPKGYTNCIWHGVFGRLNQVLSCHVLLESGANWSGLPIHAISISEDFSYDYQQLMPWSTMGENIETIHMKYLEGMKCFTRQIIKDCAARHTGIVIDWTDGFSRYPQEHKPLNLIELNNGQFALYPNNYLEFEDKHFVLESAKENLRFYKREENVYWGN
jgi:hypothetical protein